MLLLLLVAFVGKVSVPVASFFARGRSVQNAVSRWSVVVVSESPGERWSFDVDTESAGGFYTCTRRPASSPSSCSSCSRFPRTRALPAVTVAVGYVTFRMHDRRLRRRPEHAPQQLAGRPADEHLNIVITRRGAAAVVRGIVNLREAVVSPDPRPRTAFWRNDRRTAAMALRLLLLLLLSSNPLTLPRPAVNPRLTMRSYCVPLSDGIPIALGTALAGGRVLNSVIVFLSRCEKRRSAAGDHPRAYRQSRYVTVALQLSRCCCYYYYIVRNGFSVHYAGDNDTYLRACIDIIAICHNNNIRW